MVDHVILTGSLELSVRGTCVRFFSFPLDLIWFSADSLYTAYCSPELHFCVNTISYKQVIGHTHTHTQTHTNRKKGIQRSLSPPDHTAPCLTWWHFCQLIPTLLPNPQPASSSFRFENRKRRESETDSTTPIEEEQNTSHWLSWERTLDCYRWNYRRRNEWSVGR